MVSTRGGITSVGSMISLFFFYEKYVKETPERLWAIAGNHTQVCPLLKAIPSKIQGVKLE